MNSTIVTEYEDEIDAHDDNDNELYNEPMYHILGQFLVTKDNKNIATTLDELTNEMKTIRELLSELVKNLSLKNESVICSSFEEQASSISEPVVNSE
jgi:hypothetical protein